MTNIEWLGQQLRAKTANYEADTPLTNRIPINWEDRCGAITLVLNDESKAYTSLLVWGDYRDNTYNYSVVIKYITDCLWRMVQEEMGEAA